MATKYRVTAIDLNGIPIELFYDFALDILVEPVQVDTIKPFVDVLGFPSTIDFDKMFKMSGSFKDDDYSSGIKDIQMFMHSNTTKYASALRDDATGTWMIDNIRFDSAGQKPIRIVIEDNAGNTSEASVTITATVPTKLPQTTGRRIVVTPANWKSKLTNLGGCDFTGTTAEYIQMRSPTGHAMPSIMCDYENAYIEADVFVISGSGIQLQLKGGRHSDSAMCEGNAYKGSFGDTVSSNRKELFHRSSNKTGGNGYCSDKLIGRKTYKAMKGRWTKIKFEVKNLSAIGGLTPAQLSNYVDEQLVLQTVDKGDWPWKKTVLPKCPSKQTGNTGDRKVNEIFNKSGDRAIFRFDGTTSVRVRELVVQEIIF